MREALFIKKNKDRWAKSQQQQAADADELATDFTQLVDDLAFAKTFYPSSKVTQYINAEASRVYLAIYKNRKEESNRLTGFWKYDLPLTIWKHRKVMLFSLLLFIIFFAIGFFVSRQDENVARSFFGDDYVNHTQQNIEHGNPFGIYEHGNPILSWLWIMVNNLVVAFRMFASGLFAGVPTIFDLAKTAAMVGIFDQFFAARGLGLDFFMVVFVHGTLELTAFIIAAGAGIAMGKSFLFPGTIKRLDAFKQGAKDGVKIMIGMIPVLALAAFFEGFITRLYNDLSIITTIVTSLSVVFVIWYFIIYPLRLGPRMRAQLNEEEV